MTQAKNPGLISPPLHTHTQVYNAVLLIALLCPELLHGHVGMLQADRTPSFSSIFMLGFLSEANHVEPLPPAPLPQQCTITTMHYHNTRGSLFSYIHKCTATDRQTDRQTF